jgi:phosphoglycolate phosphatase
MSAPYHPLLAEDGRLLEPPAAVLFDLDGTFADTAADLAAPANALRAGRGLSPLPLEPLRLVASSGARGLIGRALGIGPGDDEYEPLRLEFLRRYEEALCHHTRVFDGLEPVLDALEARGIPWGVVSNKIERYVRPILAELGMLERSACAVGGDTAEYPKPHPAPLLHAAEIIRVDPARCVYVGDDLRDIQAGHAAGMITVAAAYGYCGEEQPPESWNAHLLIRDPAELGPWLG